MQCFYFVCLLILEEVVKVVFEIQVEMYIVEEVIDCFERLVVVVVEESIFNIIEVCEIVMKKIEVNMLGYQIIGDILDFYINVKYMLINNKNKLFYFFNMIVIKDEVFGSYLLNYSQKILEDVIVVDFLFLVDDVI